MDTRQYEFLETFKDLKDNLWYVYVDFTLDENRPFYVGKGNKQRVKKCKRNNIYWENIVAKHGWNISKRKIVFSTDNEEISLLEESNWILKLRTFEDGTPGNWGANKTKGGESTSSMTGNKNWMFNRKGPKHPRYGTKHTIESIEKNRLSNSGANHCFYGKKRPLDVCEKIRKGNSAENSNNAKISWKDVNNIRELYTVQKYRIYQLVKMFPLSKGAIWKIVNNLTWKINT